MSHQPSKKLRRRPASLDLRAAAAARQQQKQDLLQSGRHSDKVLSSSPSSSPPSSSQPSSAPSSTVDSPAAAAAPGRRLIHGRRRARETDDWRESGRGPLVRCRSDPILPTPGRLSASKAVGFTPFYELVPRKTNHGMLCHQMPTTTATLCFSVRKATNTASSSIRKVLSQRHMTAPRRTAPDPSPKTGPDEMPPEAISGPGGVGQVHCVDSRVLCVDEDETAPYFHDPSAKKWPIRRQECGPPSPRSAPPPAELLQPTVHVAEEPLPPTPTASDSGCSGGGGDAGGDSGFSSTFSLEELGYPGVLPPRDMTFAPGSRDTVPAPARPTIQGQLVWYSGRDAYRSAQDRRNESGTYIPPLPPPPPLSPPKQPPPQLPPLPLQSAQSAQSSQSPQPAQSLQSPQSLQSLQSLQSQQSLPSVQSVQSLQSLRQPRQPRKQPQLPQQPAQALLQVEPALASRWSDYSPSSSRSASPGRGHGRRGRRGSSGGVSSVLTDVVHKMRRMVAHKHQVQQGKSRAKSSKPRTAAVDPAVGRAATLSWPGTSRASGSGADQPRPASADGAPRTADGRLWGRLGGAAARSKKDEVKGERERRRKELKSRIRIVGLGKQSPADPQ